MTSAEGGSVPSGVGYGRGVPSPATRGSGEHCELAPQRVPGQIPGRKRILAYFESYRILLFCT